MDCTQSTRSHRASPRHSSGLHSRGSSATTLVASSPPIYSRDFAYRDNKPVALLPETTSMSSENVKAISASSFADPNRSHLWWAESRGSNICIAHRDAAKNLHERLLSGSTIEIYVGPQRRQWSVHRGLLCHHSAYFDEREVLELPDDDPKGFELLVKWLYQGAIDDVSTIVSDDEKYDYAVSCHKLWTLCDRFELPALRTVALDQYKRGLCEAGLVPDAEEIDEIYRKSPLDSPFRALVTNIAARQIMDPAVDKDAESYRRCFEGNADFAVDMVNAIRCMSGGMLFDDPTAEGYHEKQNKDTAINTPEIGLPDQVSVRSTPVSMKKLNCDPPRKSAPNKLAAPNATPNSKPVSNGRSVSYAHPLTRPAMDSTSSRASSVATTPGKLERRSTVTASTNGSIKIMANGPPSAQKPWTVNGVVRQINGNGASSQTDASSSTSAGRRRPPKLRRKEALKVP